MGPDSQVSGEPCARAKKKKKKTRGAVRPTVSFRCLAIGSLFLLLLLLRSKRRTESSNFLHGEVDPAPRESETRPEIPGGEGAREEVPCVPRTQVRCSSDLVYLLRWSVVSGLIYAFLAGSSGARAR